MPHAPRKNQSAADGGAAIADHELAEIALPLNELHSPATSPAADLSLDSPPADAEGFRSPDLIGQAESLQHQQREQSAALDNEWKANAVREYLRLLYRRETPEPGDAERLADVMRDLGISVPQAREDVDMIGRAREFLELHARRDVLHEAQVAARAAYKAMLKRHEAEERELNLAMSSAIHNHQRSGKAPFELEQLRRRRPLLFTETGDPPRLLEPAEESKR